MGLQTAKSYGTCSVYKMDVSISTTLVLVVVDTFNAFVGCFETKRCSSLYARARTRRQRRSPESLGSASAALTLLWRFLELSGERKGQNHSLIFVPPGGAKPSTSR